MPLLWLEFFAGVGVGSTLGPLISWALAKTPTWLATTRAQRAERRRAAYLQQQDRILDAALGVHT